MQILFLVLQHHLMEHLVHNLQLDIFQVVAEVELDIQEVMVLEEPHQMEVAVELVKVLEQELLVLQILVVAEVVEKVVQVLLLMEEVDL